MSEPPEGSDLVPLSRKPSLKERLTAWRSEKRFWRNLGFVVAGVLVAAALALYLPWEVSRVGTPDLHGITVEQATRELNSLGLSVKLETSLDDDMSEFFEVAEQDPAPGTRLVPNSVVTLKADPRTYKVPSVLEHTFGEAIKLLLQSGFTAMSVEYVLPTSLTSDEATLATFISSEFNLTLDGSSVRGELPSSDTENWTVVRQEVGAGTPRKAGTPVAVSLQIPITEAPQLIGMSYTAASSALSALGLVVGNNRFSAPIGVDAAVLQGKARPPESRSWKVSAQGIAAGTLLKKNDVVRLTVEWPAIPAPAIVGLTNADTEASIMALGFVPQLEISNPDNWITYKQDPTAGIPLLWGSTITYGVKRPTSGTIEFRVTGNGSSAAITWIPPRTFSIEQETDATLPWSRTFDNYDTTSAYERGNFSAQMLGGDSITCQIFVNGNVVSEHTSTGSYAVVSCG